MARRRISIHVKSTGLDVCSGDRICEIAALEFDSSYRIVDFFSCHVNPQTRITPRITDINGYGNEFLKDKPLFSQISDDLIKFIRNAELVVHNASFDRDFINGELLRSGNQIAENYGCRYVNSVAIAEQFYERGFNKLKDLCQRYNIKYPDKSAYSYCLCHIAILEHLEKNLRLRKTSTHIGRFLTTDETETETVVSQTKSQMNLRKINESEDSRDSKWISGTIALIRLMIFLSVIIYPMLFFLPEKLSEIEIISKELANELSNFAFDNRFYYGVFLWFVCIITIALTGSDSD